MWNRAIVQGCSFRQAVLPKAQFQGVQFLPNQNRNAVHKRVVCEGADLSEADFSQAILVCADFSQTTLEAASFVHAAIDRGAFEEAQCKKIDFSRATFGKTNLLASRSTVCETQQPDMFESEKWAVLFDKADLTQAIFDEAVFAQGARFEQVQCANMQFKNIRAAKNCSPELNFKNAQVQGAVFENVSDNCHFIFAKANVRDAHFTNVVLRNADFAGADVRGAIFDGSDLSGARFDGALFSEKTSFKKVIVKDARFSQKALAKYGLLGEDAKVRSIEREYINIDVPLMR